MTRKREKKKMITKKKKKKEKAQEYEAFDLNRNGGATNQ